MPVAGGRLRLALSAGLLAYVPVLAWVSLVATPAYVSFPWLSAFAAPVALAVLALGVLLNTRAARATALVALGVLAVWLLENVGTILWWLLGWQRRQGVPLGEALVAALGEGASRIPYWLAALFPLCVAGVHLWRSR